MISWISTLISPGLTPSGGGGGGTFLLGLAAWLVAALASTRPGTAAADAADRIKNDRREPSTGSAGDGHEVEFSIRSLIIDAHSLSFGSDTSNQGIIGGDRRQRRRA
jgi:hypothetical protein